ncbi:hypothetical protein ACF3NG_02075 [Aerococcaceae bacterium WGS1372]
MAGGIKLRSKRERKSTANLHDVLEDTEWIAEELLTLTARIHEEVVETVKILLKAGGKITLPTERKLSKAQ